MSPPWMPLYPADYRKDTSHLSAAEHGAYLLLIMHYWSVGDLPDDDRQLARIAAMTPAEWKRAKTVIEPFFQDGWRHKRIEFELAKANSKHRTRVEAGRRGGAASAKTKQNPSNAQASSSQPQSDKDSEPIGSDAGASPDYRRELFDRGLKTLERITGKTPSSCRSVLGLWLKQTHDESVRVLAAIDSAAAENLADPIAWISAVISRRTNGNNHANGKQTLHEAAADLARRLDGENAGPGGGPVLAATPRLLPGRSG